MVKLLGWFWPKSFSKEGSVPNWFKSSHGGGEVVAMTRKGKQRLVRERDQLRERAGGVDAQIQRLERGATAASNQERASQLWELLNQREQIARQLQKLETTLGQSTIIPEGCGASLIGVGSKVTVMFLTGSEPGKMGTYTIAGRGDLKGGMIGTASPLGTALLGHIGGDEVEFTVNQYPNKVRVLRVR
ncbi:MAG: hypothetical protein A2Z24_00675 [Candidatus Woykebacteria bacterium RBG_16_44_10]|uniref:Transcription elongation factor GreA/GreB C-terminal domain-containing protein n=1 Tax=Candidatus Woykebacteria bacterium RBG_16_44_10 TaxID=1802597 RepID=A0A1G1WDH6_9BACT|nr:MAG: hypothetical protein A2Z24_00675 [Candidatus Woykebacteria bacterium RBG_16_44_10]